MLHLEVILKLTLILAFFSMLSFCQLRKPFQEIANTPYNVSDQSNALFEFSIFLAGGCGSNQFCETDDIACFCTDVIDKLARYDIPNDRYEIIPNPLPRARYRHTGDVVTIPNYGPCMVLIGGRQGLDVIVQEIDIFVIKNDEWINGGFYEDAVSNHGSAVFENQIYIVGGYFQNYALMGNVMVYDPITMTVSYYANMENPRGNSAVVYLPTHYIYVIGGRASQSVSANGQASCGVSNRTDFFDIKLKEWSRMTDLSNGRASCGGGRIGLDVFAIGGEVYTSCDENVNRSSFIMDPVDQIEKYDVFLDTWEDEDDDLPSELFRFKVVNLADRNGGMYIFGGQSNFVVTNQTTGDGFYPVVNSAYRYIPTSVVNDRDLSTAEISGIIISAVIVALLLILAPVIVSKMVKVDSRKRTKKSNAISNCKTEIGDDALLVTDLHLSDEESNAETAGVKAHRGSLSSATQSSASFANENI